MERCGLQKKPHVIDSQQLRCQHQEDVEEYSQIETSMTIVGHVWKCDSQRVWKNC